LPRTADDRRRTIRGGNQRYFLTTLKPGQVKASLMDFLDQRDRDYCFGHCRFSNITTVTF
jgi:hypothetical protein